MYELYYYVPWPDNQKYQGTTDEDYKEYLDHSMAASEGGDFIEKEWVDKFNWISQAKNIHSNLD